MTAGTPTETLLIAAVGLSVGWGSTLTGLGVGLALPVLTLLGVAMPQALLAVKLPVATADLAAAAGSSRRQGTAGTPAGEGPVLAAIALAGGLATVAVLQFSSLVLALAIPAVAATALIGRYRSSSPRLGNALAWGAYVGSCGMAAALLWRLSRRAAVPCTDAQCGLRWRAAANVGAVCVLLAHGQQATTTVAVLAATQALGAWIASQCMWMPRKRSGTDGWTYLAMRAWVPVFAVRFGLTKALTSAD